MYLLDTDTLSLAHASQPKVSERLRRSDPDDVAITVITRIEILQGRFAFVLKASTGPQLLLAQQLLARTEVLLDLLEITPVNDAAAALFDKLRQEKKLR